MTELEERVRREAEKVIDPETGLTFSEMKMITEVEEQESGVVKIDFRPSSPTARSPSNSPWTSRRQRRVLRGSIRCWCIAAATPWKKT